MQGSFQKKIKKNMAGKMIKNGIKWPILQVFKKLPLDLRCSLPQTPVKSELKGT